MTPWPWRTPTPMPSAITHKTTASPSPLMTSLVCSRTAPPSLTHSMKLTTSQADLNAALRTIARAIPARATHPILTGVLLTLVIWDQTEDGHAAESFACLLAILAGANFVALAKHVGIRVDEENES